MVAVGIVWGIIFNPYTGPLFLIPPTGRKIKQYEEVFIIHKFNTGMCIHAVSYTHL